MVVATTVHHAVAVHVNRQDRKAAIHAEQAALALTYPAEVIQPAPTAADQA